MSRCKEPQAPGEVREAWTIYQILDSPDGSKRAVIVRPCPAGPCIRIVSAQDLIDGYEPVPAPVDQEPCRRCSAPMPHVHSGRMVIRSRTHNMAPSARGLEHLEMGPSLGGPAVTPEPPPRPSESPAMWDLVLEDMSARDAFGTRKHGQQLAAHDGRDALTDAYQEALDLAVYLRKALYERDGR